MLKKLKAFTLIELLIYIASFSFLAVVAFGFLIQTQQQISSKVFQTEQLIRNSIALDLIKRDLMSASLDKSDWDKQNYVFRKIFLSKKGLPRAVCVGWQVNDDGLSRLEGIYDFILHKWVRKVVSRVNQNIKNLSIKLNESFCGKYIEQVEVKIDDEVVHTVCLRNRREV